MGALWTFGYLWIPLGFDHCGVDGLNFADLLAGTASSTSNDLWNPWVVATCRRGSSYSMGSTTIFRDKGPLLVTIQPFSAPELCLLQSLGCLGGPSNNCWSAPIRFAVGNTEKSRRCKSSQRQCCWCCWSWGKEVLQPTLVVLVDWATRSFGFVSFCSLDCAHIFEPCVHICSKSLCSSIHVKPQGHKVVSKTNSVDEQSIHSGQMLSGSKTGWMLNDHHAKRWIPPFEIRVSLCFIWVWINVINPFILDHLPLQQLAPFFWLWGIRMTWTIHTPSSNSHLRSGGNHRGFEVLHAASLLSQRLPLLYPLPEVRPSHPVPLSVSEKGSCASHKSARKKTSWLVTEETISICPE